MAGLTLVIGNKAYSCWSLRPWIAMRNARIAFDEVVIPLYEPGSRERILELSANGKVPCLIDGETRVWESLAILEHLAERFPDAGFWPKDPAARALARAISAEMHAGFASLREEFTMNVRRKVPSSRAPSPATRADIDRIEQIWRETRPRFGVGGPFLFGAFSAADAMYAPVATRFETYRIEISKASRAYVEAILATPAYRDWLAGANAEPWVIEHYETA